MGLMTWLITKFKIKNGHAEVERIKLEIDQETKRTSASLHEANKALKKNITITHNIAKAMGVLI